MSDVATIDDDPAGTIQPVESAVRNRARCLVAEYLHDWGLRDPEVIARECRRIVEHAEQQTMTVPHDHFERELCRAAIELTVNEVEQAIARMASSCVTPAEGNSRTTDSIVPRLGRVLLEFPEAIQHRDRPPARLLQVLEQALAPIIPCCHHREMRPQPRTRLWKLLRRGYWHQCRRRLNPFVSANPEPRG